jgi:hypothetical protein
VVLVARAPAVQARLKWSPSREALAGGRDCQPSAVPIVCWQLPLLLSQRSPWSQVAAHNRMGRSGNRPLRRRPARHRLLPQRRLRRASGLPLAFRPPPAFRPPRLQPQSLRRLTQGSVRLRLPVRLPLSHRRSPPARLSHGPQPRLGALLVIVATPNTGRPLRRPRRLWLGHTA